MKYKSIHQKLEEIARNHLGVGLLYKSQTVDTHSITNQQIENALKAAYLIGERCGYNHGFSDAKQACDCSLEDHIDIDKTNVVV